MSLNFFYGVYASVSKSGAPLHPKPNHWNISCSLSGSRWSNVIMPKHVFSCVKRSKYYHVGSTTVLAAGSKCCHEVAKMILWIRKLSNETNFSISKPSTGTLFLLCESKCYLVEAILIIWIIIWRQNWSCGSICHHVQAKIITWAHNISCGTGSKCYLGGAMLSCETFYYDVGANVITWKQTWHKQVEQVFYSQ